MACHRLLLAVGLLALVCCGCQYSELSYGDLNKEYFESRTESGTISIESDPPGASVMLIKGISNYSQIGTTPMKWQCAAGGRPYGFLLTHEGYLERRIDVRPTPSNPNVSVQVRLHKDWDSPYNEEPDTRPFNPYAQWPEERNLGVTGPMSMTNQPEPRATEWRSRRWNAQEVRDDEY